MQMFQAGASSSGGDASREAIEKLEKEIGSLQSKVDKDTDDKDRLEETLFRARQTLEEAGFSLPEDFKKAPKFDKAEAWNAHYENVFEWAKELIGARAAITKTKGSFFLEGGEKVDGDIVRVGGVAAYGVSDKASGALVPAGAGQLKMWVHDASATAKALSEGKTDLAELGIFFILTL